MTPWSNQRYTPIPSTQSALLSGDDEEDERIKMIFD